MKVRFLLIASMIGQTARLQKLHEATPVWYTGSDDGSKESTKVPITETVSAIRLYRGYSSDCGDIGGLQVVYGTTADDTAKYDENI